MIAYGHTCDNIVSIYDIVVPSHMIYRGKPNDDKVKQKREMFITLGSIKPIVICRSNKLLVDSFISLLIFIEFGIDKVPVLYHSKEIKPKYSAKPVVEIELLMNSFGCSLNKSEPIKAKGNECNKLSEYDIKYLLNKQNSKCYICNKKIEFNRENINTIYSTITPFKFGGNSDISNYAIFCPRCKELKGEFILTDAVREVIIAQEEYEDNFWGKIG